MPNYQKIIDFLSKERFLKTDKDVVILTGILLCAGEWFFLEPKTRLDSFPELTTMSQQRWEMMKHFKEARKIYKETQEETDLKMQELRKKDYEWEIARGRADYRI